MYIERSLARRHKGIQFHEFDGYDWQEGEKQQLDSLNYSVAGVFEQYLIHKHIVPSDIDDITLETLINACSQINGDGGHQYITEAFRDDNGVLGYFMLKRGRRIPD